MKNQNICPKEADKESDRLIIEVHADSEGSYFVCAFVFRVLIVASFSCLCSSRSPCRFFCGCFFCLPCWLYAKLPFWMPLSGGLHDSFYSSRVGEHFVLGVRAFGTNASSKRAEARRKARRSREVKLSWVDPLVVLRFPCLPGHLWLFYSQPANPSHCLLSCGHVCF